MDRSPDPDAQGDPAAVPAPLTGVPETLLWTLYFRALEASRPDPALTDQLAVDIVSRLDYPFTERLGSGTGRAQWQALRARTFDDRIRSFLREHPGGTVVALGEGLETQLWRVDDGAVRWVGVDLPETGELRRRLLPAHPRRVQVDGSVLDDAWAAHVDASRGVLLTAQGLLMYLRREDVHALLVRLARRFPGASVVFDGVPRWSTAVTSRRPPPSRPVRRLVPPPMPWWMDAREAAVLRRLPGIAALTRLHPPRGRGVVHGAVLPVVDRLPVLRSQVLPVWSARFA